MECKYCGSEILDTYTICPICGKSLIEKQVLTAINSNLDSTEENKQNITKKELNRSKKMMKENLLGYLKKVELLEELEIMELNYLINTI